MRRRFTFFLVLPAVALMPVLLVAFGACSNQGEGERCSKSAGNGGNDDCQSGLECNATVDPKGPRCCPHDLSTATTAACAVTGTVDANSSVPDASTATDTSSDGNGDAAGDAPAEASSEAGPDAPPDVATDATAEAALDGRAAGETSTDAATEGGAAGDGSDATAE